MNKPPEIMAPVSSRAMLEAAIHNGADSVYVGMPGFNARGRSDVLSLEDIEDIIRTAHLYDVAVYIAFNVLIFDDELENSLGMFLQIHKLGVNAWIIQDPALALCMKTLIPGVCIHASTQMSIVHDRDILFYSDLGIKRFTLARELSVNEIDSIRQRVNFELEVFIHGSLCVSYSGQCFTSSGFGGRSANRGECAQSCRHEYELFSDGKRISTQGGFLVSPRDLAGYNEIAALAALGIDAIKIEGRLKSPGYVAAAVRLYRTMVSSSGKKQAPVFPVSVMFNRDANAGWLEGINYRELVNTTINSHTGVYLGKVASVAPGKFLSVNFADDMANLADEIQKGDGILVCGFHANYGSHVYDIKISSQRGIYTAQLYLSNDFPYDNVQKEMPVYLSSSDHIERELTKTYTDKSQLKRMPLDIKLTAKMGEKMSLRLSDENSNVVEVYSENTLEQSQKHKANFELIRDELAALSGTVFKAKNITLDIDSAGFYANRVIKELRQRATEKLTAMRTLKNSNSTDSDKTPASINDAMAHFKTNYGSEKFKNEKSALHILVRNPDQLDVVLNLETGILDTIYLDYTYGYEFAAGVKLIHSKGLKAGIAGARIYKPGEEGQIRRLLSYNPDVLLARNTTTLSVFQEAENKNDILVIGDFSLNITNAISANYFLKKGLHRITTSYDLVTDYGKYQDTSRIFEFLKNIPGPFTEISLSYYLPSFYMEYCLFSKHLGNGEDSSSCGFPCKFHEIKLKDRKGDLHPVIADRNCRNTMFNGRQKKLFEIQGDQIKRFINQGVKNFRVEFGSGSGNVGDDINAVVEINRQINEISRYTRYQEPDNTL